MEPVSVCSLLNVDVLQVILEYLLRERNMRIMPVRNYLVFYVLTHNDLIVTVMRIMYGGRDIDRQLEILEIE